MTLSPYVNVDEKMPAKMLHALGLHETRCVVTGVTKVSEEQVKNFLSDKYGEKFASTFDPKFLFNIQGS
jgi:hypothetical protein